MTSLIMESMRISLITTALAMLWSAASAKGTGEEGNPGALSELQLRRRPAALCLTGNRLHAANRESGTISTIDIISEEVVHETKVGKAIADIAKTSRGRLLALDSEADRCLRLKPAGSPERLKVVAGINLPDSPQTVTVSRDAQSATVTSLWSRRVSLVSLTPQLKLSKEISLPFAPREQWRAPDGRHLVVADAFGGNLAIVDLQAETVLAHRSLGGHQLRGLALGPDGKRLYIAHQQLNPNLPTVRSRIFWGQIVANLVRGVPLDTLMSPSSPEKLGQWTLHPLGEPEHGSGDPGDLHITANDTMIASLSGINQVAFTKLPGNDITRVSVESRPTAMTIDPKRQCAFVANTLSDSISIIDIPSRSVTGTVKLGPMPEPTLTDQGERLFYNAKLSLDGWYSCNSCHINGHSNGLRNDNFDDGTRGTPKRVLSLLGVGDTGPWAWNGARRHLPAQIQKSIRQTMRGDDRDASRENAEAIAAFLRTLEPPPSVAEAVGSVDRRLVQQGRRVFNQLECGRCHEPPTYTSPKTYDVGVEDDTGNDKFNPPSLRGVSQRPNFFHDNRASSLREVFTRYRHPDGDSIPQKDLEALLAYLKQL